MKHYRGKPLAALAIAAALAVTGVAGPALAAPTGEMGEEPLTAQAPDLTAEVAVPAAEEIAVAADSLSPEAKISLYDAKVTVQTVVYNREDPVMPKFTVTLGDKELVEGRDFTASIRMYPRTTVHVQGKGDYYSYAVGHGNLDVPLRYLDVEPIPEQTYTGNPIEPELAITIGERFKQQITVNQKTGRFDDVSVTYHNNINPGFGRATITGSEDYRPNTRFVGTRDIVFAIRGEAKTFPDVAADHWAKGVIGEATSLGMFSGYSNGKFGPNDKVTRGQVATVLWSLSGKPEPGAGAKQFPDVKSDAYYEKAVAWAFSAGVVSGYTNGNFGPDDKINREEFTAMVTNYATKVGGMKAEGSAADYSSMKDAGEVSKWAQSSVGFCFKSGIISGTKDGRVNPKGNATRAEAAKMIVYLYEMLSK